MSNLHRTAMHLGWVFFLGALGGCQAPGPANTDIRFDAQERLLQEAIVRLDGSPQTGDAEVRRLLKQLETELGEAERRHAEAQRRIVELEEEVTALRQAAGFAVDHIEILYFTHTTEKEIDLWVTPFDRHNDVVKTAGSFRISLHRPGVLGLRRRGPKLAEWRFSASEVETHWEGQLFEGYHLKLAWPGGAPPQEKTVVLSVEFTTAEGKTYTATKELDLRSQGA